MKTVRFLNVALALVLVAGVASAQAPWCPDGPNAVLTVNGDSPDAVDPINHDINVTLPGIFNLQIVTNANAAAGLALLASPLQAAAQVGFPAGALPWDPTDSLDLGVFATPLPTGIQVIGDGLNPAPGAVQDLFFASDDGNVAFGTPPTFTMAYNLGTALAGQQLAFQAIVREATNPPLFFDNTSCASAELVIGLTAVAPVGDDGSSEVAFTPGFTFDFHGVQYPSIWVNGNGFANFGALTSVAAAGFACDYVGLVGAEPFIAVHQTDWNPGVIGYQQVGTSATAIWGDPANGGNMAHFGSSDLGNIVSLNFELNDGMGGNPLAGNFQISDDILANDPTLTFNNYGTGARGHGPGGAATTVATVESDLNELGSTVPGEVALEEHDLQDNGATAPILNGWDGAGSLRGYNNADTNWNGRTVDFFANPAVAIAGDSGYTSIPNIAGPMMQPADVGTVVDVATGAEVATISDAGGELVAFSGAFERLLDANGPDFAATTCVFDPSGALGGPFPGATIGVGDAGTTLAANGVPAAFILAGLSGPGTPHRNTQVCQVVTPIFPMGTAGTVEVQFNFADGSTASTSVLIASAGTNVQTFTLGDDAPQAVTITNSIPFYANTFNTLNVSSNGPVTFGAGTASFLGTVADAFNGFGTGGTEAGTGLWLDLNPGGTGSGATYVVSEDTVTGATTVGFNNQIEWGSNALMGSWSIAFDGLGTTTYDFSGMIVPLPAAAALAYTDGDGLLPTVGSDTDLTDGLGTGFASVLGTYSTGVTAGTVVPDSVGEDMPVGTDLTTAFGGGAVLNILDAGAGTAAGGTLIIF